jgi:hypothetical protein
MKKLLAFTAAAEVGTGMLVPALVGRLLFGVELDGVAVLIARVTGIALIALGIACWPGPALAGMLTYSAAVTLQPKLPRHLSTLPFLPRPCPAIAWS